MGLFGYYAAHSFYNQLRKIFKTWVLIFILVCGLMGGLIGYGAAKLEEAAEADSVQEEIEEPETDWQMPISGEALTELAVGLVVIGVFFFEAIMADTHGSKIFLPADVNLLFASPMKPQSVLMFRLATQLGTALAMTVYLAFQIPNLMLNLGMSGWTACGILIAWFGAILIGKLLQVLLYTVCSTNMAFKQYLRKAVYVLAALLLAAFFLFYRTSGMELLPAADAFFNGRITRWIPIWGWLKALPVLMNQGMWLQMLLMAALLLTGGSLMVWCIWQIKADFYEDAMAKSEETAARMEKAMSEKSGSAASGGKRKKERKESLVRDGMNHGWGANVFFWKSIYNRFRFAHFGFLTKTMETYFAAALGAAAIMRFLVEAPGEIPVVLTLGGLVFFRAMGNPLEEDTEMDFFRLIPESTWRKLFYSLLGGTCNCILDLVFPMLAASLLLSVNPLKLFIWLPVIVSVDFYATSVAAFINLSVPVSAGKIIKQLVQILFIYFGLIPDIAAIAIGIVFDHLSLAALIVAVINLGLGFLFFSLASVFLEPKGKDYVKENAGQDLARARKHFSVLGMAIFLFLLLTSAFQTVLSYGIGRWMPRFLESSWALWMLTFGPEYVIGLPVAVLLLRKVPAFPPEKNRLTLSVGVKFFFVSVFMMYAGNLVGTLITSLIGLARDSAVENPLMTYIAQDGRLIQVLFMVILAPLVEEYIFRKLLIDRMRIYGGKLAVVLSALIFGLFHGNLSQFFYAFGLGLVFGYIYLNTGNLRNTIAAHMLVNFCGSVFSVWLLERMQAEGEEIGLWTAAFGGYAVFMIVGALIGLTLLGMNLRKLRYPAAELQLPKGKIFSAAFCNAGMLLILLASLAMVALSLHS